MKKYLEAYAVSSCHVRSRDIVAFCTQDWSIDDPLEPRPTMVFFYYPNEPPDEQWAVSELDNMTGIHGCTAFKPQEQCVFVSDPGEVYVVGQGYDDGEQPVDATSLKHFSAVRCIATGYAYAVGMRRDVYKRTAANRWTHLTDKLLSSELPPSVDHAGFVDIDGYSDTDVFACGGQGDLWHFDGKTWAKEDVPTNASLERICCSKNGLVYITTGCKDLLIGNRSSWSLAKQDIPDEFLEDIVQFGSQVLVSTVDTVYTVAGDKLVKPQFSLPPMSSYSHLAAGDSILVIAGSNEAFMYDTKIWTKIYQI
jgi:hypothetical protein